MLEFKVFRIGVRLSIAWGYRMYQEYETILFSKSLQFETGAEKRCRVRSKLESAASCLCPFLLQKRKEA